MLPRKIIVSVILIFYQFMPIYVPKKLENAPAQVTENKFKMVPTLLTWIETWIANVDVNMITRQMTPFLIDS